MDVHLINNNDEGTMQVVPVLDDINSILSIVTIVV